MHTVNLNRGPYRVESMSRRVHEIFLFGILRFLCYGQSLHRTRGAKVSCLTAACGEWAYSQSSARLAIRWFRFHAVCGTPTGDSRQGENSLAYFSRAADFCARRANLAAI